MRTQISGSAALRILSFARKSRPTFNNDIPTFGYSEGLADPARALDRSSKSGIVQLGISARRSRVFDAVGAALLSALAW